MSKSCFSEATLNDVAVMSFVVVRHCQLDLPSSTAQQKMARR